MLQAAARRGSSQSGQAPSQYAARTLGAARYLQSGSSAGSASSVLRQRYLSSNTKNGAAGLSASLLLSGRIGSTSLPIQLQLLQARRYQSTESATSSSSTPMKGEQPPPPGYAASSATSAGKKRATTSSIETSSEKEASKSSLASTSKEATTSAQASSSTSSPSTTKEKSSSSSSKDVGKPKDPLMTRIWAKVKHEAAHYWSGTKLLGKEIRISARLQLKLLRGKSLTRREKRQLKRTTQDLLRLIPFIPFLIIPFMELLLPVALKIFPNMLPSTFEDKHVADEKKRKLLKVRLEMAKFLQETIRESGLAKSPEKIKNSEEFRKFFRKVRSTGEQPSTEDIVKVARLFEDDLTLDNLSRPQLVSMCRYMNINAFGTDNFLRYTVRNRLAQLGRDDTLIDAEGVESLSASELAHACASRGIRTGISSEERQKAELAQWIDLHLHHNLSGVLLILSKAFAFTEKPDGTIDHLSSLKHTLSSLPDTLLNETELEMSPEAEFKERLEVLQQQEELIEDEAEQEQEEEEARRLRKEAEAEEKARLAAEEEERLADQAKSSADAEAAEEREKFSNEKETAKEMLEGDLAAQTESAAPKKDAKDVRMTTEQLSELGDALFILSARSSVRREREDLAKLMEESQATLDDSEASPKEGEEAADGGKKTVSALEKRIKKMITQIDEQLDAYDKEVSTKLNTFDCPDGKLSVNNLRTAFEQIRHRPDDETITALIDKLDVDHDGFVPLEDVTSLAEVEGLGVVIDDAADQILGEGQEIRQDEGLSSLLGGKSSASSEKSQESTPSGHKEESKTPKKPKREEIVE